MRSQPAAGGRGTLHASLGWASRFAGRGWLYYAAGAALLIVAAALRLYDLGGADLRSDEAVAALQAQGSLSDALEQLRCCNTAPPLNTLFLWAAQRIAISEFSVRIPAVAASVLTVAALIFLLPKVGVARPAALLAGLMAAVSAAALLHAQDAREYGMDALVAALIMAGLLAYLKDGKRALLCVALLIAPLAQYGLALFGAAALGTLAVYRAAALFAPSFMPDPAESAVRTSPAASAGRSASILRGTLRLCLDVAWPFACFLAGLAGAYALALREQLGALERIQGYLAPYYYASGESEFALGFALAGVWDTLRFHLPPIVALAGIAALGAALVARRRDGARLSPIVVLFALSLAIAAAAGALSVYPLGGVRQNMYLGPVVFAAFGCALHAASVRFPPRARIAWAATLALGIAVAGAFEIAERNPYGDPRGFHRIIAALEEAAPNDAVYAAGRVTPITQFYQDERADAYAYGNCAWGSASECLEDLRSKTARVDGSGKAWLIIEDNPTTSGIDAWLEQGHAERVAANSDGVSLYLIRDRALIFPDEGAALEPLPTGEPSARGVFDVYVTESEVVYFKEPCIQADTEARFFLHFVPKSPGDLPEARRGYGFDNADFDFFSRGGGANGKCVARVPLPAYEVRFIRTGQFISGGGAVWRREFAVGSPSP